MKLSMQSGDLPLQFGIERGYALIREAGFDGIDWSLDHAIEPSKVHKLDYRGNCLFERSLDEILDYYGPSLKAIRENDLTICQAHSFFPSYVSGHSEVLEWSVPMHIRGLEFCEAVGVPYFVIHGIASEDKDEKDRLNMELYMLLAEYLRDKHVTVCLENLFTHNDLGFHEGVCCDPMETVDYIDQLNTVAGRTAFALCLDTGHMNLFKRPVGDYVHKVGNRIGCTHIHDNHGNHDSHMAPLTGSFPWEEWISAMRDTGYDHDLSFETFAQTNRLYRVDPDLVLPCLKMIRHIGESIRKQLEVSN